MTHASREKHRNRMTNLGITNCLIGDPISLKTMNETFLLMIKRLAEE